MFLNVQTRQNERTVSSSTDGMMQWYENYVGLLVGSGMSRQMCISYVGITAITCVIRVAWIQQLSIIHGGWWCIGNHQSLYLGSMLHKNGRAIKGPSCESIVFFVTCYSIFGCGCLDRNNWYCCHRGLICSRHFINRWMDAVCQWLLNWNYTALKLKRLHNFHELWLSGIAFPLQITTTDFHHDVCYAVVEI